MKLSVEELQEFLDDVDVLKDISERHTGNDYPEGHLLATVIKVYISVVATGNIDTISTFASGLLKLITEMEEELAEGHKNIIVLPTPDLKQ